MVPVTSTTVAWTAAFVLVLAHGWLLLMLAVVIALGVLAFAASSGAMSGLSENYAAGMTQQVAAREEKFTIEQVAFSFSGTTGADIYVRNTGTIATTLVAVYVSDLTSGSFVSQTTVSTTVNVGTFTEIPHTTMTFSPTHGHEYSFTLVSSLGNSETYEAEAT